MLERGGRGSHGPQRDRSAIEEEEEEEEEEIVWAQTALSLL
jgi:hypothetical protein